MITVIGSAGRCLLGTALFRMLFKSDFQIQYWVVIAIAIAVTAAAAIKGQNYKEAGEEHG